MLLVFAPVTHWVWDGGFLSDGGLFGAAGVKDFAGGIVVHETAAIAALLIAIFLGPCKNRTTPPHSRGFVAIGAGMLWVGWFGFNGGSQLAADGTAAMALTVTHISAAAASLTWAAWERLQYGKASLIGLVTGTIVIAAFGYGNWGAQLGGLAIVGAYTIVVSIILIKLVGLITPLRVDIESEVNGLDLSVHGERAYDMNS